MKKFNKSGFTLIEILIVMIIVGILAAIALPNLYNNVAKSHAEEAMSTISSYRATMEACITKYAGNSDTACVTSNLGGPVASSYFSYSVSGPTANTDTAYTITGNGTESPLSPGTDYIVIARSPATWPSLNVMTCLGYGKLSGAC